MKSSKNLNPEAFDCFANLYEWGKRQRRMPRWKLHREKLFYFPTRQRFTHTTRYAVCYLRLRTIRSDALPDAWYMSTPRCPASVGAPDRIGGTKPLLSGAKVR